MKLAVPFLLLAVLGCPSLTGLEELPAVPTDFPLRITGETGPVTTLVDHSQVSFDLPFDDEEQARARWLALRAEAEAGGFAVVEEGRVGKRDRIVLEGAGGKLELGCCMARADTRRLVFVTWWKPHP